MSCRNPVAHCLHVPKGHGLYEEIGASFNGNEVKIRVPKNKNKVSCLTSSQVELRDCCTCGNEGGCDPGCGGDIKGGAPSCCSGGLPGMRMMAVDLPADLCNHSRPANTRMAFSEARENATCNITPIDAPPGVQAHKVLHPDKDVFLLQIGRQGNEDGNEDDQIEVELVTPRAPEKKKLPPRSCKIVQCDDLESASKDKKKKGKKGKKKK